MAKSTLKRNSPYSNLPSKAFWRTGVAESNILITQNLWQKKFDILANDKIASAGSCFAQHLSRRLISSGYRFMDVEPPPKQLPPKYHSRYGYSIYSGRYGNIYTTSQLLQLAKEALGILPNLDYAWEDDNGRFYDPLRPNVEPEGLESYSEILYHRRYHLSRFKHLLENCDIFVFTLGLTEAWICNRSDRTLPTAPGTIAGSYDPDLYYFKNFNHEEIKQDLKEFINLVYSVQGHEKCRFLLTVSPVPLTATATKNHVLVATTHSKSTLRSVAAELYDELPNIDYFPSYEIINSPWSRGLFFETNLRSVSPAGVDAVMRIFFTQHFLERNETDQKFKFDSGNKERLEEDAICEEALLQGFAK